jgi:MFS family permease
MRTASATRGGAWLLRLPPACWSASRRCLSTRSPFFLKPLAAEFGWSREAVSAAFGIAALAIAACSPPLGWLLDRYPARRIILPCLTIFGCTFASLSLLTRHLWHLYAIFLILGMVGNGTAHLAYTRVLSTWFRERRGLAFSILLGGGAVGAMVLPPIAEALIHAVGWRASFAILGAGVLVIGLPCGSRVRERPLVSMRRQRRQPACPSERVCAQESSGSSSPSCF